MSETNTGECPSSIPHAFLKPDAEPAVLVCQLLRLLQQYSYTVTEHPIWEPISETPEGNIDIAYIGQRIVIEIYNHGS